MMLKPILIGLIGIVGVSILITHYYPVIQPIISGVLTKTFKVNCSKPINLEDVIGQQVCIEFIVDNVTQADNCLFITNDSYKLYIEKDLWDKWKLQNEFFLNKHIRVTGEVTLYDNIPEIEIRNIEQIEFL